MFELNETACRVALADTQAAFASVDMTLGASLQMTATLVDTFKGSNLPAGQSQVVYDGLLATMNDILKSRANLISVTGRLHSIAAQSNVPEVAYGCPVVMGKPGRARRSLASEPAAEPRATEHA